MLGYFLLLLLFAALFTASLYFGFCEWLRPRDAAPLPIDVDSLRQENYFGVSFRSKMEQWLRIARALPASEPAEPPVLERLEKPEGETILVLASGRFEPQQECRELIYCEGHLQLGRDCVFHKEVYCRGDLAAGDRVRVQALASDGNLTLCPEAEAFRWVDAQGKVLLRRGAVVHGRVSSLDSIELESQVTARSLYARVVFTSGYADRPDGLPTHVLETPSPEALPPTPSPAGLPFPPPGVSITQLAPDTSLVNGDLNLLQGSRVDRKLVVRGRLRTAPDCQLRADVKAREIHLGARNQVWGNLISEGDMEIGEGCFITRNVVAEGNIFFRKGVRVGLEPASAAVSAGRQVRMESDVAVHGKVVAGEAIQSI